MIRGLLDSQRAVVLSLDDDDAFDLKGGPVLQGHEQLIGFPRSGGVTEVSDKERVGTVGDDRGNHGNVGIVCYCGGVLI